MDFISHYFSKQGLEESSFRTYLLLTGLALGLIQIGTWFFKFLSFAYRHILKGHNDFKTHYNQGDSWAVISGGSDGIGE